MLQRLLPRFDEVIVCRYLHNPRGVPPEELGALVEELSGQAPVVCTDPAAAWETVHRRAQAEDLICVTGSFFLAAEMRLAIQARPLNCAEAMAM
jgi:dihydrofolate synthase/folylpolyglutamate synthase